MYLYCNFTCQFFSVLEKGNSQSDCKVHHFRKFREAWECFYFCFRKQFLDKFFDRAPFLGGNWIEIKKGLKVFLLN